MAEQRGGFRPTAPQNNPANINPMGGDGQSGTQPARYIPGMRSQGVTSQEVYTGDVSLSRRALQRVLIRSRLEQMEVELREQMIYHVPADLKDLWTRFQEMRGQIIEEQKVARKVKEKEDAIRAAKRKRRMENLSMEISLIGGIILIIILMAGFWTWLYHDKKKRWPELEQKTYQKELEKERKLRNEKIIEAIRYLDEKNLEQNKKLITPNEEK